MPRFNAESTFFINEVSKINLDETTLALRANVQNIESVAHTLRIECGWSGWSKVEFLVQKGFLFGFSGDAIAWDFPIKQEVGSFVIYEIAPKVYCELERSYSSH